MFCLWLRGGCPLADSDISPEINLAHTLWQVEQIFSLSPTLHLKQFLISFLIFSTGCQRELDIFTQTAQDYLAARGIFQFQVVSEVSSKQENRKFCKRGRNLCFHFCFPVLPCSIRTKLRDWLVCLIGQERQIIF